MPAESPIPRRTVLGALGASVSIAALGRAEEEASETFDVFVYGSTPGGIAAAMEAARRGCHVALACPQWHPGGMAASGLCTTDAVRRHLFGGFVLEFIEAVKTHYEDHLGRNSPEWPLVKEGWYYEPSVAERVFTSFFEQEPGVNWRRGRHLLSVERKEARIVAVDLEGPGGVRERIRARTFIDATYEGDLAAAAKVPYRVGRESRDEHGEPLAGIHYMNFRTGKQIVTPDTGRASEAIQAFCARSVFTTDAAHRRPIEKPATYDEHLPDIEPLLDDFKSGRITRWVAGATLPGKKIEMNGHIEWPTSLNCPGKSWKWPEAKREERAKLAQFHVDHAAGMMWFLQNDPRVPGEIRAQVKEYGLHDGEFKTTGGWPWQIYVRQGRRIEGRALITQHNFIVDPKTGRTPKVEHPIALGEHSFDVHPCHDRTTAVEGFLEGVLWYPKKDAGPAQPGQIPWGALLPKQIDNLLVPVAMSCTHVAMSVLRMEPVWMTTGQVAGAAAAQANLQSRDVGQLDPAKLPNPVKMKLGT